MGTITSRAKVEKQAEPAWPTIGPARQVFVVPPSCPACGAYGRKSLKSLRSKSHDDGVVERATLCLVCDWRFVIVVEPATLAE